MSTSTFQLRLDPPTFRLVTLGQQTALVADAALLIEAGDMLVGREWGKKGLRGEDGYTGQWLCRKVLHIILGAPGSGVEPGFVVLCLNSAVENEWAGTILRRKLALAERQGVSPDRFWRIEERREARHRLGEREPEEGEL